MTSCEISGGDTVHPSTLTLLDEIGLGAEFAKIPHRLVEQLQVQLDTGMLPVADFRRIPGPHKHLALVPQWDFLDLLADAGRAEPTFTLRMQTKATRLLTEGSAVTGVRYRSSDGGTGELHADLTVACDGRRSVLRDVAGLRARSFGVPLDVWWFRLPRRDGDATGGKGAYLIRKGTDAALRAQGIETFRRRVAAMIPLAG